MSKEMSKQLAKCPFCGKNTIYETFEKGDIVDEIPVLFCNSCKIIFKVENDSPYLSDKETFRYLSEKNIKAWNTRTPMDRIVERLKEAMRECRNGLDEDYDFGIHQGLRDAIEIIKEEGEMNE